MKVDNWKLYNFYLAVVSFVSVIAVAITVWIVLMALWKYLLISDDEYVENRQSWRTEQCDTNMRWDQGLQKDVRVNKTEEEIVECKEKAKLAAIKARSYDLKDMFISSFAWFIVFLILFWFHYPKFLAERKGT